MHELSYSLSRGETHITVGKSVGEYIQELPENSLVVFPGSVSKIVETSIEKTSCRTFIIGDGEEGKSLDSVIRIIHAMKDADFKRNSTIVSIGGGSTSDAVGMAASMYMRGVDYVSIPTTLLSMVDASLGGKNAVNLGRVKNLLGSFYSPSHICVDVSLVRGMPPGLVMDGFGEIAKYALIVDSGLYGMLMGRPVREFLEGDEMLEELVTRCIRDKMEIVAGDEFDIYGKRIMLNFGHTLGHAVESATDFSLGHGTAVAHGMLLELHMAKELDLIGENILNDASRLLEKLKLPYTVDARFISRLKTRMLQVISSDKKATRTSVMLPIPREPGIPEVFEVKLQEVADYLERLSGK